jgi:Ser/Thr protein kinase RdoA (MazF antagonist)
VHEIHEILQHYPSNCQPTRTEPLGNAGGMSGAQFWRLATPRGELALRRWPPEHPTPERLRFIHAVLAHAAIRGISVLPVPFTTRDGQSFVEHAAHLWELAPWMPGIADYEYAPSDKKLRAAMTALAEIHVALTSFPLAATQRVAGAPRSVTNRLTRLSELHDRGLNQLSHAIIDHHWPALAPLARQFLNLLPTRVPQAIAQLEPLAETKLPVQPCLRDIWHDHVLFTGDAVTGIVDFGATDIDSPACDIARLLGSLAGDDANAWQKGLATYSAVRQLSVHELHAVTALDLSGTLLAGCNWIRWIYIEGRKFENPTQVMSRFRTIVARTAKPRSG